jgi:hypothetical protein
MENPSRLQFVDSCGDFSELKKCSGPLSERSSKYLVEGVNRPALSKILDPRYFTLSLAPTIDGVPKKLWYPSLTLYDSFSFWKFLFTR